MNYLVIGETLNGEQSMDYYETYEKALAFAERGDRIYKLIEEIK